MLFGAQSYLSLHRFQAQRDRVTRHTADVKSRSFPAFCLTSRLLCAAALFGAACTGFVGEPSSSTSTTTASAISSCRPVAQPMRALTARQYDAAISQLLQDNTHPARVLQVASSDTRFDNHADWVSADETLVRFYATSAEKLAERAVANQAAVLPCANPSSAEEQSCITRIIETIGRRAYRRTLNSTERTALLELFRTIRGLSGSSWNEGLSAVLQSVLQSPQFIYVTEVGAPIDGALRPTSQLTPLEVATKLALLIWGSLPDDALLDAAEGGRLVTKAQVATQAKRLLADPRS